MACENKGWIVRKLLLAAVLVLAVAVISFVAARVLLIDADLAGSVYETALPPAIAGLFLASITYVHQALEGRRSKFRFTALPGTSVPFEQYLLPWPVMVIYGVCVVYVLSGLGTVMIWAFGALTGLFFSTFIAPVNTVVTGLAFFFVGVWNGLRCERRPFLATVCLVLAYVLLSAVFNLFSQPASIISTSFALVAGALLYLTLAVLGLWRGNKARYSRYVQFLLGFVAPATRSQVVDLVYAEVQRLASDRLHGDVQVA